MWSHNNKTIKVIRLSHHTKGGQGTTHNKGVAINSNINFMSFNFNTPLVTTLKLVLEMSYQFQFTQIYISNNPMHPARSDPYFFHAKILQE